MKTIKETLIGTMKNGKNVLNQIEVSKIVGPDFSLDIGVTQRTIDQLNPKKLDLVVVDVEMVTSEAKTIRFASKTGYLPPFEAGQYLNVFTEIDGVRTSRPYSLSSSPKQRGYYEITVAKIPTGFVSDFFIDTVKVGDEFEASSPAGVFHYNPVSHHKHSVFLAGGSGVTPFMSMTREILEGGLDRVVTLIYGMRSEDIAIFHNEFCELAKKYPNFKYVPVVSDANAKTTAKKGFIDSACVIEAIGDITDKTFYLCGPQIMTDFCKKALEELNVRNKDIRREMFGSTQNIQNEAGYPSELTGQEVFKLTVGDKVIDARANESLLVALERSGIRVNVCCRSGECSLCKVKLAGGKVFMPRGVMLRHADEVFGYIHSCKAFPISDVEIIL